MSHDVTHISVHRYRTPRAHGWAMWFEPKDRSWIGYVGLDGRPLVMPFRDPATGAILGDDPAGHAAHIEAVRREGGLRIGMPNDGSCESLAPGEPVFPLGIDGTGGVGIQPVSG